MMYLPAPLRGKFEVDCELTAPAGREIRLVYGGQVFGLKADLKNLERAQIGRPMPDVAITPPLEKVGEWYAIRLAVDAGPDSRLDQRTEGPRGPGPAGVRPLAGDPVPGHPGR